MGKAISDTSVLNYLGRLGRFELLRGQFGQLVVPQAVVAELDARPELPGASLVRDGVAQAWIDVATPQNNSMVELLRNDLGIGESHAIALAVERSALLLIDEADGRRCVSAMGIAVVGTVGVLLRARLAGVIPRLGPVLRELVENHGFR